MQQPNTLNLFVYGTLREGGALHSSWLDGRWVTQSLGQGIVRCSKMYAAPHGCYPYLVVDEGTYDDVTIGEVYVLSSTHRRTIELLRMEINAGYVLNDVEVELDNGEVVNAIVCAWNPSNGVGKYIASGDWLAEERQAWV